MGQDRVEVCRLKEFASHRLPPGSLLRELLLSESEQMEASAFVAKLEVWLRVARREFR